MAPRVQLQTLLESILGSGNVYFQEPPSTGMAYPCIVYKLDGLDTEHAANKPYALTKRYLVTVIDRNPDSLIPGAVAQLPSASFSRAFRADKLNHQAYTLYF